MLICGDKFRIGVKNTITVFVHIIYRFSLVIIIALIFILAAMFLRKIIFIRKFRLGNSAYYVTKPPKPEIPINPLNDFYSASKQKENGIVYDRKPFRLTLQEGKFYSWCLCGRSKNNPLCDGTHKDVFLKITQRPIKFTVNKTKEYWLCNCKQTKNRPFCDGTHKNKEIQEATTIKV